MPAYCTLQDLVGRYGEEELAQLAPAPGGQTDAARVQRAIEDASAMADGWLSVRHPLPLTAQPPLLVRLVAALARYELHLGGDRQPTEQVTRDRDAAASFLRDVAAGKADLGITTAGDDPAEDEANIIVGAGQGSRMTEDVLDAFRGPAW